MNIEQFEQNIDEKVENELRKKNLINKVNYECYRYVDDYFLFYNDKKKENVHELS